MSVRERDWVTRGSVTCERNPPKTRALPPNIIFPLSGWVTKTFYSKKKATNTTVGIKISTDGVRPSSVGWRADRDKDQCMCSVRGGWIENYLLSLLSIFMRW